MLVTSPGYVNGPNLHHSVTLGGLTEPLRAELRCPLLSLEVHVDQPEAVAIPINPLEVVLCTPVEVTMHWYAVGRRTLEFCEASAHEHHSVRVVHPAVLGNDV